jgi:hypothetical protein
MHCILSASREESGGGRGHWGAPPAQMQQPAAGGQKAWALTIAGINYKGHAHPRMKQGLEEKERGMRDTPDLCRS